MKNVLREALGNIATWRAYRVLVHVDLTIVAMEKCIASMINDVASLKYAGMDILFSCSGSRSEEFAERASQRGIQVQVLDSIEGIENLAESLGIAKLFFLCDSDGIFDHNGLISELSAQEGVRILEKSFLTGSMHHKVRIAVELCIKGVKRVHFVNAKRDGALLEELLTDKGSGTMIYGNVPPYKEVRRAEPGDVVGIAAIIRNMDPAMSEESIMRRIDDVMVFSVDGTAHAVLVACCCDDECLVEYLVHSGEFRSHEALNLLLQEVEQRVSGYAGAILVNPNHAPRLIGIQPWFLNRGYVRNNSRQGHHRWWKKAL